MNRTSGDDPKPFGSYAPNARQRAVIAAAHGSGLKRAVFRPLLSHLVHLLGAGPIDVTYQGASFRLHHLASDAERGVLFNPDYNLPELDFLREYLPAGGVFIDVGANAGTCAIALAKHVGANGRVIAIEPLPSAGARLAFNASASKLTNLTLVKGAAGEADVPATGDVAVPSYRLLTILKDNGVTHVDALKIDVEGHEDRVLVPFFRDAPQALWPKAVVIDHLERHVWRSDCIADMTARGYAVAGRTRSNTLLVRR